MNCDQRDDIKVFDFGLARELKADMKPDKNGLYKLTGMTGSPRYMVSQDRAKWMKVAIDVVFFLMMFSFIPTKQGP
jgi:hypothetical protein